MMTRLSFTKRYPTARAPSAETRRAPSQSSNGGSSRPAMAACHFPGGGILLEAAPRVSAAGDGGRQASLRGDWRWARDPPYRRQQCQLASAGALGPHRSRCAAANVDDSAGMRTAAPPIVSIARPSASSTAGIPDFSSSVRTPSGARAWGRRFCLSARAAQIWAV